MKEKRVNKSYSEEFKREAVTRSKVVGPSKTCEELGIVHSVLYNWRKQYLKDFKSETNTKAVEKPSYEDLEKEIKKLKKELGYVEEINKILKKSTAIFSSSHLGGSL